MLLVLELWVFHYESYHVLPFCPYHNYFWKELVELFYHDDTVDGGCVWQVVVYNTRNRVVHEIVNYDLVFFTRTIFTRITIFWPMGDT